MSKILSQDEIDALLESSTHRRAGAGARRAARTARSVAAYNFRRPDRVSKEQIRSLHFLHDRFARNVSTSLSAFLRTVTEVTIVSVEQFAYSEFLMSLPEPTAFYAVSHRPARGRGRARAQPGGGVHDGRSHARRHRRERRARRVPLTEIEQNVIDSVVKLLLEHLTETWARRSPKCNFRIHGRETRPQMLQVMGAQRDRRAPRLRHQGRRLARHAQPLHPGDGHRGHRRAFVQGSQRTRRQPTEDEEALARRPTSAACTVPVTAMLETTLAAEELLKLRPGDIVALGHSVDSADRRAGRQDQPVCRTARAERPEHGRPRRVAVREGSGGMTSELSAALASELAGVFGALLDTPVVTTPADVRPSGRHWVATIESDNAGARRPASCASTRSAPPRSTAPHHGPRTKPPPEASIARHAARSADAGALVDLVQGSDARRAAARRASSMPTDTAAEAGVPAARSRRPGMAAPLLDVVRRQRSTCRRPRPPARRTPPRPHARRPARGRRSRRPIASTSFSTSICPSSSGSAARSCP